MNRYLELIGDALTVEAVAKIRHCVHFTLTSKSTLNTGLVLGTEEFRQQVVALRLLVSLIYSGTLFWPHKFCFFISLFFYLFQLMN